MPVKKDQVNNHFKPFKKSNKIIKHNKHNKINNLKYKSMILKLIIKNKGKV